MTSKIATLLNLGILRGAPGAVPGRRCAPPDAFDNAIVDTTEAVGSRAPNDAPGVSHTKRNTIYKAVNIRQGDNEVRLVRFSKNGHRVELELEVGLPVKKNYSTIEVRKLLGIVERIYPIGALILASIWEMYAKWADKHGFSK